MSNLDELIGLAQEHKEAFKEFAEDIVYEEKGILFSEMFFLSLCVKNIPVHRIIESGRARGQSTLMLSKMFPDSQIISIEHDPNSPDVAIAQQRLENVNNVELQFGDATEIIPKISRPGDIVLIDGPKGYRALRFALRLLASRKFPMIFVHDTTKGTSERKFLDKHKHSIRGISYSDTLDIARISSPLDNNKVNLPKELRIDGQRGYGFSLACLAYDQRAHYRSLILKSVVSGNLHRWFKR